MQIREIEFKFLNKKNGFGYIPFLIFFGIATVGFAGYKVLPRLAEVNYEQAPVSAISNTENTYNNITEIPEIPEIIVTHTQTPEPVKGVYMTACIAGLKVNRNAMMKLIDDTELNSVIIDIKDYSGTISIPTLDPVFSEIKKTKCTIKDIKEFIHELHQKNIYVIGRITVFQDPLYSLAHP